MEQLIGMDAWFLYMETSTAYMHTLKIAVVDPSTVEGGADFSRFRSELEARLPRLKRFRCRVVDVPGGLGHPVWIEDPDFDIDRHVHLRIAHPPGDEAELDRIMGDIASAPLDRRRPLWEITMVDGLADGRIAFVAKLHHAIADGGAALQMLLEVMHPQSEPEPPPTDSAWQPDEIPPRRTLLRMAGRSWPARFVAAPRFVSRALRGMSAARKRREDWTVMPPRPFHTSRTAFNKALTTNRICATKTLPVGDLRAVRRATDVSFNDVYLAVVAGALRRWLASHGGVPERPLLASVPMATPSVEGREIVGNHVDNVFACLWTDVADPEERLHRIHETMEVVKDRREVMGSEALHDRTELIPPKPFSWLMRTMSKARYSNFFRPPINLVVSNVAGPRETLAVAGARLESIHSVGPILEGIGLNITGWTYLDDLEVTLLSCPELMPDLHELADLLEWSLDELKTAVGVGSAGAPSPMHAPATAEAAASQG